MLLQRCFFLSEFGEPLNKLIYTEECSTYYTTPIMSLLYTNDVILTNQRVCTVLTLNILRRNTFFTRPSIIPFDTVPPVLLRTNCRYVDMGTCGLYRLWYWIWAKPSKSLQNTLFYAPVSMICGGKPLKPLRRSRDFLRKRGFRWGK